MKYPQKLIDFLADQDTEGHEIFTTQIVDGTMWIIPFHDLEEWVVVVTWYDGEEDFSLVNICGKAFDRLQMVMNEAKVKVNPILLDAAPV
jgi:hypothetical protein